MNLGQAYALGIYRIAESREEVIVTGEGRAFTIHYADVLLKSNITVVKAFC